MKRIKSYQMFCEEFKMNGTEKSPTIAPTKPTTKPAPSTKPSPHDPIRRDKPSVEPAPKALDKGTVGDVIDRYIRDGKKYGKKVTVKFNPNKYKN